MSIELVQKSKYVNEDKNFLPDYSRNIINKPSLPKGEYILNVYEPIQFIEKYLHW